MSSEKTTVSKTTITTTKSTTEIFKGTGGTNLIPFLKQMRDETVAKEISELTE